MGTPLLHLNLISGIFKLTNNKKMTKRPSPEASPEAKEARVESDASFAIASAVASLDASINRNQLLGVIQAVCATLKTTQHAGLETDELKKQATTALVSHIQRTHETIAHIGLSPEVSSILTECHDPFDMTSVNGVAMTKIEEALLLFDAAACKNASALLARVSKLCGIEPVATATELANSGLGLDIVGEPSQKAIQVVESWMQFAEPSGSVSDANRLAVVEQIYPHVSEEEEEASDRTKVTTALDNIGGTPDQETDRLILLNINRLITKPCTDPDEDIGVLLEEMEDTTDEVPPEEFLDALKILWKQGIPEGYHYHSQIKELLKLPEDASLEEILG